MSISLVKRSPRLITDLDRAVVRDRARVDQAVAARGLQTKHMTAVNSQRTLVGQRLRYGQVVAAQRQVFAREDGQSTCAA